MRLLDVEARFDVAHLQGEYSHLVQALESHPAALAMFSRILMCNHDVIRVATVAGIADMVSRKFPFSVWYTLCLTVDVFLRSYLEVA